MNPWQESHGDEDEIQQDLDDIYEAKYNNEENEE